MSSVTNSKVDTDLLNSSPARLLTKKEVARLLGISMSSVRNAMLCGDFPKPIRIGERLVRWRLDEIEDWVASKGLATA